MYIDLCVANVEQFAESWYGGVCIENVSAKRGMSGEILFALKIVDNLPCVLEACMQLAQCVSISLHNISSF